MRGAGRRVTVLVASAIMVLSISATAPATEEESTAEQTVVNTEGAEVYVAVCASCHQTDGRGIAGAFPPLVDNPNVDDSAYLVSVIEGGRDGEIVVGGQTFNGVMPAFTTLSDEEVAAVVAYVQIDLGSELDAVEAAPIPTGPVAGTELPSGASTVWTLGIWLGVLTVIAIAVQTVLAPIEGPTLTWGSAWLRAGVIVVFFSVTTMWLPSALIEWSVIATAPQLMKDMLASGVWIVALAAGIYGLRWAQKGRRI